MLVALEKKQLSSFNSASINREAVFPAYSSIAPDSTTTTKRHLNRMQSSGPYNQSVQTNSLFNCMRRSRAMEDEEEEEERSSHEEGKKGEIVDGSLMLARVFRSGLSSIESSAGGGGGNTNGAIASQQKQQHGDAGLLQPEAHDVLFGRGHPFHCHPGNLRMKRIVNAWRPTYQTASIKYRREILKEVLRAISITSDGKQVRFLKSISKTKFGPWEEVTSMLKISNKVSHALRSTYVLRTVEMGESVASVDDGGKPPARKPRKKRSTSSNVKEEKVDDDENEEDAVPTMPFHQRLQQLFPYQQQQQLPYQPQQPQPQQQQQQFPYQQHQQPLEYQPQPRMDMRMDMRSEADEFFYQNILSRMHQLRTEQVNLTMPISSASAIAANATLPFAASYNNPPPPPPVAPYPLAGPTSSGVGQWGTLPQGNYSNSNNNYFVHQQQGPAASGDGGTRALMAAAASRGHEPVVPEHAHYLPLQHPHRQGGVVGSSRVLPTNNNNNNNSDDELWYVNMFHTDDAANEPASGDIFD